VVMTRPRRVAGFRPLPVHKRQSSRFLIGPAFFVSFFHAPKYTSTLDTIHRERCFRGETHFAIIFFVSFFF